MATEKQMQSSRENGAQGGVKTQEGKAVSSLNALKHGILAYSSTKYDLIDGEEIYRQLADEFGTHTPSRNILVEQLALTVLRLARCARAETEILKEALNPRIVEQRDPLALELYDTVVVKKGEPATISTQFLERLSLIYERYEPRLVNRMLRLLEALKAQ